MKSQDIVDILKSRGPQTGSQLLEQSQMEALPLWQVCRRTPSVRFECIGKRFVRLDRAVDGFARLSPSIRREFLTYTILGLENQAPEIEAKARKLRQEIQEISQAKRDLAREAMENTVQSLPEWESMKEQVCFILAGDITYNMAHSVPRPEISTGKLVRGSDLDIIVIAEDSVPKESLKALDQAIYRKKHFLLVHPNYQEEIDYLVKDFARVRQQLEFDSFQHMIASKIMHEGEHLYGSSAVYQKLKTMVKEFGVPQRLAELESKAIADRANAESSLLNSDPAQADAAFLNLFYTREEGDEIY
ncbi:MAG: hypothetical protein QUT30_11290 [Acidobacteriota bacterium]|nr:hypothetical protein [Acidobacteriota bacterium]